MSVLLIYYFMPYWAYYLLFLIIIPVLCILVYFNMLFIESAHFLIHVRNDFQTANQVVEYIGAINNASSNALIEAKRVLK